MVFKAIVETWYFPRLIDNGKSHASMHTCMFVNNVTGVEPTGLKAGQRAPFTVDAKGAGDGELVDDEQVVVGWVLKIDEPGLVVLGFVLGVGEIDGNAADEEPMKGAVVLNKAGLG